MGRVDEGTSQIVRGDLYGSSVVAASSRCGRWDEVVVVAGKGAREGQVDGSWDQGQSTLGTIRLDVAFPESKEA